MTAKLCQPGSSTLKVPSREVGTGLVVRWFLGWAFAKHLDVCDPMTNPGGRQQSNLRKRSSGRCPGLPGAAQPRGQFNGKASIFFVHANDSYYNNVSILSFKIEATIPAEL